jgi:hypothetical protein
MRCSTAPGNFSARLPGIAMAALALQGAPAHKAVRYAATLPGVYGDFAAFLAELSISFFLIIAILVAFQPQSPGTLYAVLCSYLDRSVHRL